MFAETRISSRTCLECDSAVVLACSAASQTRMVHQVHAMRWFNTMIMITNFTIPKDMMMKSEWMRSLTCKWQCQFHSQHK
eukprot:38435-Amphidinium_carterae.1